MRLSPRHSYLEVNSCSSPIVMIYRVISPRKVDKLCINYTTTQVSGKVRTGIMVELLNSTGAEFVPSGTQPSAPAEDTRLLFHFMMNVVVDGTLCLLGYVGNGLIVVVLQRASHKTSNSVFLQALAVADNCFLTYVIVFVVLRNISPYTGVFTEIQTINHYVVAIALPFGWTSQTITIWLTMLVAVDRYVVVKFPLKATLWCTPRRALWACLTVAITAVLFNTPRWPRYYFVAFTTNINGTFVSHLQSDIAGWDEDVYRAVYHIGLTFILLFIIPLSIMTLVNAWLIIALRRAASRRSAMTAGAKHLQQRDTKSNANVTRMMIIIVSIFILCQLPDFIAAIVGAGHFKIADHVYDYYAGIKESLLVLNSAINFYLYMIFYRSFRRTFLFMFFGKKKLQNQQLSRSQADQRAYTITHRPPSRLNESQETIITRL